jgi:DNA/RNA-binding domain of Phe-tRNA-synthetase-like protein
MLVIDSHPLLDLAAFVTHFPAPLGELTTPPGILERLQRAAPAPLQSSDEVRGAVRNMLRHGGFKPTGRSKPASEYLIRAAEEGKLSAINPAVDTGNVVSLHSGLPISVVDLDALEPPLRVAVAAPKSSFVFNHSGQVIDVSGLVCLHDAQGSCANAVKDAQRSKTSPATTRTISLIWGTNALPGRSRATLDWYMELCNSLGARVEVLT